MYFCICFVHPLFHLLPQGLSAQPNKPRRPPAVVASSQVAPGSPTSRSTAKWSRPPSAITGAWGAPAMALIGNFSVGVGLGVNRIRHAWFLPILFFCTSNKFSHSCIILHMRLGKILGLWWAFKKFAFWSFSGISPSFDLLFSLQFLQRSELLALRQRALNW